MTDWPYVSGTVWYHPTWCHYIVLTYLCGHDPAWVLLSIEIGRNTTHGGWVATAISEKDGKDHYSFDELPQRLKDWECKGVWMPTKHNQYEFAISKERNPEDTNLWCATHQLPKTDAKCTYPDCDCNKENAT